MLINALISLINSIAGILLILIVVHVLLSWIVSPYHPVRQVIDRIVDPLLDPIRRVIPPAGGFDFSPIILAVLIEVAAQVLVNLLVIL